MTPSLYEQNGINTKILIHFIEASRLPSVIFQLSRFLGKKEAIDFYLKAQGKRVYVPKRFSRDISLLQYLSVDSCKKLIREMPGTRIDFRKRNTSLEICLGEAFRRYVGQQYRNELWALKSRFRQEYHLSRSYLDTIIREDLS